MTVITPVGGIIGPRPTGASFRTGVWKQQEVFERRVDGVWVTPLYPELAPYATNSSGHILVATYNTGSKTLTGSTQETLDYVRPSKMYPNGGACLDSSRWSYLYAQAVTNNANWRFDLRYYDEPTGSNVFGKFPQNNNVRMAAYGNSCYNMSNFKMDYGIAGGNDRNMWHDEVSGCSASGVDYNHLGTGYQGGYNNFFSYTTTTTGGPSSSRWLFGQATSNYYTAYGNVSYTEYSQNNRPVSMWLLPP